MRKDSFWHYDSELDRIAERSEAETSFQNSYDSFRAAEEEKYSYRKLSRQEILASLLFTFIVIFVIVLVSAVMNIRTNGWLTLKDCLISVLPVIPFTPLFFIVFLMGLRHVSRQAEKLCRALDEVAKGNLNVRIDSKDQGHYKKAYDEFNSMCENLSEAREDLKKTIELANTANVLKARFISTVSHEIRTPLNSILGLNELILRETAEKNTWDHALDIKNAGNTLSGMLNDILVAQQIEDGKIEIRSEKFDLRDVITDLVNSFEKPAEDKGLKFYLDADEKMPYLFEGDVLRLKEVLINLISNALNYTDKGSVTLSIRAEKQDGEYTELEFCVRDTGRGVDKDDLERLQVPFERIEENRNRDISGLGLGLAISGELLKLMGSTLKVESIYGKGSVFSFSLREKALDRMPIGDIEEAMIKLKAEAETRRVDFYSEGVKILAVDDSEVNLTIVSGLLKDNGITPDLAESGREACELSKKTKYDLILVDYLMPEMDGLETLKHIRNEKEGSVNASTPVIVLTANAGSGAKEEYLKNGFDDYISKPFEPHEFEALILKYLPKEKTDLNPVYISKEFDTSETEAAGGETPATNEAKEKAELLIEKISVIPDIDTKAGITFSGTEELYANVIDKFAETGLSRADTIEQYFEQQDISNFTVQVHALKSAARIAGCGKLSKLAEKLEAAGNSGNTEFIEENTAELLRMYRDIAGKLEDILSDSEELEEIDRDSLNDALEALEVTVEGFDFDSADSVMAELKKYKMPGDFADTYGKLKNYMAEVAREDILRIIKEYRGEH